MQIVIDQLLNPVIYNPEGGKKVLDKAMRPVKPGRGRKYGAEYAEKHKRWFDQHQDGMSYSAIARLHDVSVSTIRSGIRAHEKKIADLKGSN